MQANETQLNRILGNNNQQYVVPLFQRAYSWDTREWQILWNDLSEMLDQQTARTHFIGSIVSMPAKSVPEGVGKFLLIDGQQRITTIYILLILLRDRAIADQPKLADEIQEGLLINKFRDDDDYYKLMPTQADRAAYKALIGKADRVADSRIQRAYDFFGKRLTQNHTDIRRLLELIQTRLSLVSIVLNADDNPHLVFESLNAKGRPLTQADLIRNYFFMRINISEQDGIYGHYWQPMQTALSDGLTDFIRHFLNRNGRQIRQTDIYQVLKDEVSSENALAYLQELSRFAKYFEKLRQPERELNAGIARYLVRLNRIEVTTAYPLLLNLYDDYNNQRLSAPDFVAMLALIENYLIRRFVCGYPTNQLNRIFPYLYKEIAQCLTGPVDGLKRALQGRSYPRDAEFVLRMKDAKLYGSGERLAKTKLLLESLEESYAHRETVVFDKLTIEHVMPQTLTLAWQQHLGEDWLETHALQLHTIGNLTLTGYNSELSNSPFLVKQAHLIDSHLELNRYFGNQTEWTSYQIEQRASQLTSQAMSIWPYFGDETQNGSTDITGSTPSRLIMLGQRFSVKSWREVLLNTLNTIVDTLEPDQFDQLTDTIPHLISRFNSSMRESRQLSNGYFVEVNLSARRIESFCKQVIQTADLSPDDWQVVLLQ
jgi:uncharacterized protein with ParB-like and HNH nuclease domain